MLQLCAVGRELLTNILLKAILHLRIARGWRILRKEGHAIWQIVHQRRIQPNNAKRQKLQADEGNNTFIHLHSFDGSRRNAPQVKQRKAERRRQKAGLDIQANHNTKPYSGNVCTRIRQQDRRNDWHDNHGNLDKVEEEAKDEDHQHHDNKLCPEPAWQRVEELAHKLLPAKGAEGRGQHRSAEQNDKDKRSRLRCFHHNAVKRAISAEHPPATPCNRNNHQDRSNDTQCDTKLVLWRINRLDVHFVVAEHISQHEKRNQSEDRRHKCQLPVVAIIESVTRHHHRTRSTDSTRLVHSRNARDDRAQNKEDKCERWNKRNRNCPPESAVKLTFHFHGRRRRRFEVSINQDVEHVDQNKQKAWDKRTKEHLAR